MYAHLTNVPYAAAHTEDKAKVEMVKEVIGGQVPDWQIAEFMETRSGDVEAVCTPPYA
jgi:hypothetical protein